MAESSDIFVYKEFEVDRCLKGLINHMEAVENCRVELQALGQQWDLLTILGQMSGGNMDMTATRQGFRSLTSDLLNHLALEILNKTAQQVGGKAQVAVDIVIRNLFERTADIGFLATDDDIREFLRGEESDRSAIVERFREYVAKYSVYDNIILLRPDGQVCAQLDQSNEVSRSDAPLVQEAVRTSEAYVEVFRHSDLVPDQKQSLIYAYRVTESNAPGAKVLGVLCLCFRFENEMEGVFRNLQSGNDQEVMTLLDASGCVIASSDHYHIPVGVKLPLALEGAFGVIRFAGRAYLAKTCPTRGYQGFMGLGWHGHVMLPLEYAFEATEESSVQIEPSVLASVMQNHQLFSEALRRIPAEAETIQQELDCTVWNGNVRQEGETVGAMGSIGVLLWEVGRTGRKTQSIFENSIGKLHQTVVSSKIHDAGFVAALAIDIMDRNLYERANDCRWWALTTRFREILDEGKSMDAAAQQEMCAILKYINDLYTVYTLLFLFDTNGRIVAVSDEEASEWLGQVIDAPWVDPILGLRSTQHYAVSDFSPSPYYGERATFIYGAAVKGGRQNVVGGIGIVFDSEPQFRDMLEDALPRSASGDIEDGAFALFVDGHGCIISSAGATSLKVGDKAQLPQDLLHPTAGSEVERIVTFEGRFYAAGAKLSEGYREYKSRDDSYHYDVTAIVMLPLGDEVSIDKERVEHKAAQVGVQQADSRRGDDSVPYASFYVGGHWMAVPMDRVREAVLVERVTIVPGLQGMLCGAFSYRDQSLPVIALEPLTGGNINARRHLLVVLETGNGELAGLKVNRLGSIVSWDDESAAMPEGVGLGRDNFVKGLIKPILDDDQEGLVIALDPTRLMRQVAEDVGGQDWRMQTEALLSSVPQSFL